MKVIDSRNIVIAEGNLEYCQGIIRVSHYHPADVTEKDKILYHDFLNGKGWAGNLNIVEDEED